MARPPATSSPPQELLEGANCKSPAGASGRHTALTLVPLMSLHRNGLQTTHVLRALSERHHHCSRLLPYSWLRVSTEDLLNEKHAHRGRDWGDTWRSAYLGRSVVLHELVYLGAPPAIWK